MNIFQLLKKVIDDGYADLDGSEEEKDELVKEKLDELGAAYHKLSQENPRIDYSDPATRIGYVFRYVSSHAHIVAEAVEDNLYSLLDEKTLTVSCIGGGPGSDFLGIVLLLLRYKRETKLKCYLLDGEEAWGDAWSDVDSHLADTPFSVNTHFQCLDVTDPDTWTVQKKYLNSQLFTMIYFVSEVYANRVEAEAYFDHLFENAQSGAFFLYIDNRADCFTSFIEGLATKHGLSTVATEDGKSGLPASEEKKDLEPYLSKFDGSPKLGGLVSCRVFQKP